MILCLYHDRSSLADVAGLKGAIEDLFGPYGMRVQDRGYLHILIQGQRMNAARILRHLSTVSAGEPHLSLWVVGIAIFYPGSGPIFGCTAGRAAVVSRSRLDWDTLAREALHEVGHLMGLDHCHEHCIMSFSGSIDQARRKPEALCPCCASRLRDLASR